MSERERFESYFIREMSYAPSIFGIVSTKAGSVYKRHWIQWLFMGWEAAKRDAAKEQEKLQAAVERLRGSRDFYKRRCEQLQSIQSRMRDPERKAVCEILANGIGTDALAHQPERKEEGDGRCPHSS